MKVLFISHDASRTGAPILLYRLIEELKIQKQIEPFILLKKGGELKNEFEKLGKTYEWDEAAKPGFVTRVILKLLRLPGLKLIYANTKSNQPLLQEMKDIHIVLNNTVTNTGLLKQLPLKNKKIFSYFHELEIITGHYSTKEEIEYCYSISEKVFIPSAAVKQNLVHHYGITDKKFEILPYLIPALNFSDSGTFTHEKSLKQGHFMVTLCGYLHWRKGADLVPLLIREIVVKRGIKDIHFFWVGLHDNSLDYKILKSDLSKMLLSEYFSYSLPAPYIANNLNKADVFVLLSREDAFPLVALEAASLGKPIICFKDSGGIPDFVGNDAGIVVDYLDIEKFASAIIELKNNASLKKNMGEAALQKFVEYNNKQKVIESLYTNFKNV